MIFNGLKRPNGTSSAYQSMVSSPFDAPLSLSPHVALTGLQSDDSLEITDDSVARLVEAEATRLIRGNWQQFARHYRLLEFGSAVVLYVLALVVAMIPVHERPIPGIQVRLNATAAVWSLDPAIDEKKVSEKVPMWLLLTLSLGLPVATNIVINYVLPVVCQVRIIGHDTRDFLLSLFQATAFATFFTLFTKNITGRFRPSFYDMCKWNHDVVWDGVLNLCTDPAGEEEGRKSFPSGHASFAWASMLILALYLLGRSRLNCENRSDPTLRGGKKSLMLFMCCTPILLASWIAISRCIDNRHHYSDILAGSIIGVSALFAFNYNYGSIFGWDSAGLPLEEIHERRMNAKRAKREKNVNESQLWQSNFDMRPQMVKHMSSEYIVDLNCSDFDL